METTAAPTGVRVYADTSVYGAVFDEGFEDASLRFFEQVLAGRYRLVISSLVRDEIAPAPAQVRQFFAGMVEVGERFEVDDEAQRLCEAYLSAGIVSEDHRDDALHVAMATVTECSMIVSWNFKHIVQVQRMPLYNAVNVLNSRGHLVIASPLEVIEND